MKCPTCEGKSGWSEWIAGSELRTDCPDCKGTGEMGFRDWLSRMFWERAPIRFVEWYGDLLYPDK